MQFLADLSDTGGWIFDELTFDLLQVDLIQDRSRAASTHHEIDTSLISEPFEHSLYCPDAHALINKVIDGAATVTIM